MTIKDIKKQILRSKIDAAEALFEVNPNRYIEKYIEMSESKFTISLPPRETAQKIRKSKMQ